MAEKLKDWESLSAENDRLREELAACKKQSSVFEAFFNLVPVGLAIVTDRHGQNIRTNPAFARMLCLQPDANASLSAPEADRPTNFRVMKDGNEIPPDDLPLQKSAATGKPVDDHECHLVFSDGRVIDLLGKTIPLLDDDGLPSGALGAFVDISRLRRAEAELLGAKDKAVEANKAKDQFLAMLSHELRTPLTAVVATMDAWEISTDLPETFRDEARLIRRNIDMEARLIDDLLDLQRIEHGKLLISLETADAHELLHSVLAMIQSEFHLNGVRLVISFDAQQHHVNADPARLQQVFWNVLKNACKFTPKDGTIRVRTRKESDAELCVSIEDTGIGMSEETLRRIFDPFEQADDKFVKRAGGLGLGLAIAKNLIELQHGRIAASSEGPGRGSTLAITLPTVAPLVACADGASAARRRSFRPLGILLIEDHVDTARAMSRLLRTLGHHVDVSGTVADTVTIVRGKPYDVLLSDIGLPDGTGLDLIAQIRAISGVPVIALTGYAMDDDAERFRKAGFTAHLAKPVNFQKLELLLQQVTATAIQ